MLLLPFSCNHIQIKTGLSCYFAWPPRILTSRSSNKHVWQCVQLHYTADVCLCMLALAAVCQQVQQREADLVDCEKMQPWFNHLGKTAIGYVQTAAGGRGEGTDEGRAGGQTRGTQTRGERSSISKWKKKCGKGPHPQSEPVETQETIKFNHRGHVCHKNIHWKTCGTLKSIISFLLYITCQVTTCDLMWYTK